MSPSGKIHKLGLPEKTCRDLHVPAEELERLAQEAVHTDNPFLARGSLRLWCAWGWGEGRGAGGGWGQSRGCAGGVV